MDDRFILGRLFVVVPELAVHGPFLKALLEKDILPPGLYDIYRKAAAEHARVKAPRGRSLLQRLALVAPELVSVRVMQVLTGLNLVSAKDAHILRVLLRAAGRVIPGTLTNETAWSRMAMVFDDIFSPEMVSWIRALDNDQIAGLRQILLLFPEGTDGSIARFGRQRTRLSSGDAAVIREMLAASVARAQVLRSVISTGRTIRATLGETRKLDDVWDVLTLAFDDLFSEKLLRNLVRAGVISPERFALARSLQQLGAGVWRKTAAAHSYEGWAARTLLMSEGIISPETIKVLVALGRITPGQARILYPVASAIREVTRGLASQWRTGRRYRVVPGEAPIKTFARATVKTDQAILRLLAEAARDASRDAERLAAGPAFAGQSRAAQQRLVTRQLHLAMRDLMENTGSMIIFGEKQAAAAALESMTFLQRPFGTEHRDLQRTLRYTAQAGVDAYVSREENLVQLSRRVYRSTVLLSGQVDREIAKGLLRGLSARELAARVEHFIDPRTPGGASYAATRLARTEINNAFHQTQIRYTREMPWVEGYRWHLSGSHGRPDVCNEMARHGVYRKTDVPSKPHPHCLCYITTETHDNATFYRRMHSGAYDNYLEQVQTVGVFDEDRYTLPRVSALARDAGTVALLNGLAAVIRSAGERLGGG